MFSKLPQKKSKLNFPATRLAFCTAQVSKKKPVEHVLLPRPSIGFILDPNNKFLDGFIGAGVGEP